MKIKDTLMENIRLKYTENPQTGELTILEEDHYYPYGLTHQGYQSNHQTIGFDGQVFTLVPVTPQAADSYKYKFNGMEWQDEFDVNVYDFGARLYMPDIGRWGVIDPKADDILQVDLTPYNFSWNNPIKIKDPDGKCPWCWGAVIGIGAEIAGQVASGLIDGKSIGESINDINYGKVAVAAVTGAATGGLSTVKVIGATAKIYKATAINATVAGGNMAKQKVDGNQTVDPKEMVTEVVLDNIQVKSKNTSNTTKTPGKTKSTNNSKAENNNTSPTPERSDAMKQPDSKGSTESRKGQEGGASGTEKSSSEGKNSADNRSLDIDNNNDIKISNTGIKL